MIFRKATAMHVANILVIAPYPEMLPELQEVASEFPDASFSFETGDLAHGLGLRTQDVPS